MDYRILKQRRVGGRRLNKEQPPPPTAVEVKSCLKVPGKVIVNNFFLRISKFQIQK